MLQCLHRGAFSLLLLCLLASCAAQPPRAAVVLPSLHLAPASLGHSLAVQQQLRFHMGEHEQVMDALLEVDADEVRLMVQAMGQTGVRLRWDGHTLQQQRAPWLPAQVRGERVLDDLQLALWPADAIRAALPAGWILQDDAIGRRLEFSGKVWWQVTRTDATRLHLDNRAEGYQLEILSSTDAASDTEASRP